MYVLAKKFGNEKISGQDGFSEVSLLIRGQRLFHYFLGNEAFVKQLSY